VRRLALLGCGAVSRKHYLAACRSVPECIIEWFVDEDLQRAEELAKRYGHGRVTSDYRDTFDSVDAAIVALPNYLHSTVSVDFLLRGLDVLCEKPIARNASEARLMIRASERSGARLAVNHVRRRHGCYRIAKQLMHRRLLGRVRNVLYEEGFSVFDWPARYLLDRQKAGGGVLLDWGIHAIDILHWLFDANLDLISYEDDGLEGIEANSDVSLKLKGEDNEIPCRVLLSRNRTLANNLVIQGETCSLEIRHASDSNGVYIWVDDYVSRIGPSTSQKSAPDPFAEQIESFLDNSSCDYVAGTDALKSVEFTDACYSNRKHIRYTWETDSKPRIAKTPTSAFGKILVVGASGFLGTRLVEKLSLDHGLKVRAGIHRPQTAVRLGRLPVEFVNCDLLDRNQVMRAVEGCEVVVNCAQDTSGNRTLDVFVEGTRNLLRAAVKHNLKRYVHVSSGAILGFSRNEKLIEEEARFVFSLHPYIRGKAKSEKLGPSASFRS
jgi:predicted dehydrogenase